MAKKREPQGKSLPDAEVSGSPNDRREGLSKEAWITIGTIAAALITGVVTLLVHVLPSGDHNGMEAYSSSLSLQPKADEL